MNFKQQIKQDVSVFLNLQEFGDEITIDDIVTVGLWDDVGVSLVGDDLGGVPDANSFGLYETQRILYVPAEGVVENVLGIEMPVVEQRLYIKGEYWMVMPGTQESMGIIKLVLQRIDS